MLLESIKYRNELDLLLSKAFIPAGYEITKSLELDETPESSKYEGLAFSVNDKSIVFRKGKVTPDRPGAFLAIWKRPFSDKESKPIPLKSNDLDYLLVQVEEYSNITSTDKPINPPKIWDVCFSCFIVG